MAEITQVTITPFEEGLIKDGNEVPIGWRYANITTETTTEIKAGSGVLHSITINEPVASSVITIYDNTAASGSALIGTITLPGTLLNDGPRTAIYDVAFKTGLTIKTGTGASNITVSYI